MSLISQNTVIGPIVVDKDTTNMLKQFIKEHAHQEIDLDDLKHIDWSGI